jgi:hypothetical protein
VCQANTYIFSAGREERHETHIQQQKPFCSGVYNYQSDAVPANHYGFNNYRTSSNQHGSMEGCRRCPKQHTGHEPRGRLHHGPLSSSSQTSNGRHTLSRLAQDPETHSHTSILGMRQHPGSYYNGESQIRSAYPEFQPGFNSYGAANSEFGRMNGDRQFNNRPRQALCGRFRGQERDIGKLSWHERTVQPHCQGQNVVSSKAAAHQLRDPEQRGMKRDWCVAESSDSPQQNDAKMRPESAGQTLRQVKPGDSGALAYTLPATMQGIMKRDGCEAEATVSPRLVNSSEVTLEGSDQPQSQAPDENLGAASDELPVPEQGSMIINFCEAETSDTLGQLKHQADQDGSPGATTHELADPEQQRMETDLCQTEASEVRQQVQDGSSEAASHEMLLPEQQRTETDLHEVESDKPYQVQYCSSEAASHKMSVPEQQRAETDL